MMADEPQVTEPETPAAPTPEPREPEIPSWGSQLQQGYERMERALAQLASAIQTQHVPAGTPQSPDELKDEELWALAQQGNRQAFEMYQARIADRRFAEKFTQERVNQSVNGQLGVLYQSYPELANPSHPLTQRALAFKQALIQMGASPTARQTDLDAILRAIADSRDVIAPRVARSAPTSGQIGASPQQTPAAPAVKPVTPEEARLARHMGTKDPAKALERFYQRNADGRSSISPTIASALDRT